MPTFGYGFGATTFKYGLAVVCTATAGHLTRHSSANSGDKGLGTVCLALKLHSGLSQHATRLVVHCSAVVCTATVGHLSQHSEIRRELPDVVCLSGWLHLSWHSAVGQTGMEGLDEAHRFSITCSTDTAHR